MSIDFHVAVHALDWPTLGALNRCMAELQYPIQIVAMPSSVDKPLGETPDTKGLVLPGY